MNYLDLVRRVRRESGRSGSGPAALVSASGDDLRIADWVNDAWSAIQRAPQDWRWMRRSTTSALPAQIAHTTASLGVARFGRFVPESDRYRMRAFATAAPTTEWSLRQLPPDEFRRRYLSGGSLAAGKPAHWAVDYDGGLLLGPEPDEACTIRYDYKLSVQTLAADTDIPELPAEHHLIIVWSALMSCATNDAAIEVYQRAAVNFEQLELDLLNDQGHALEIATDPLA